ncbi:MULTISPECIES: DUF1304 domain-containing protein [unclassified Plantibacter]|jgi:putative membrane protein|uniref:DUF1304 domain-containing protein n=1 Tax=unclassified Plantibacter TaxID=2624265 RepID=UPI003D34E3C9
MMVVSLILIGIASLIHLYIFVLESVRWMSPATWKTFGIASETEAAITRPLALNQGFYNLFLAIASIIGIVLLIAGQTAIGATLVFTGAGSMVLAGLVLVISNRSMWRSALIQLAAPALGLIFLGVALAA